MYFQICPIMFDKKFPTNYELFQLFCNDKTATIFTIEKNLRLFSEKQNVPIMSKQSLTKPAPTKKPKIKSKHHNTEFHKQQQANSITQNGGVLVQIRNLWLKFVEKTNLLPRNFEKKYQAYQKENLNAPNLHQTIDIFPPELHEAAKNYQKADNPTGQLVNVSFKGGIIKGVDMDFFIDQIGDRNLVPLVEVNPEYENQIKAEEEEKQRAILKEQRSEKRKSAQFADYSQKFSSRSRRSIEEEGDMIIESMGVDDMVDIGDMGDKGEESDEPSVEKKVKYDLFNNSFRPDLIEVYVRLVAELGLGLVEYTCT